MVTTEDNDSVVVKLAPFEGVKKPANAVIDIADSAIVRSASLLNLLIIELNVPEVADLEEALAVRILLILRYLDLGQLNIHALVHVPVLLLNGVWVVGVRQ